MRLLERYILVELLRVFTAVLGLTTCLLLLVGVFGQVRENGLGPLQVLQILPFVVPSLLPFTIPATLLLTVCVVYGRMAGDREIIAAKAAGIHIAALLWPSYFLGAVLSVVSLIMLDQAIPWSFANIERVVTLAMEDIFLDVLRTQNQVYIKERGITITVMEVRDRTLIFPTFRISPNGRSAVTLQAEEAKLSFDLRRQEVILQMKHGIVDVPGQAQAAFETEEKSFPLPSKRGRLRARNLQIDDIVTEVAAAENDERVAQTSQAIDTALLLSTGNFSRLASPDFAVHRQQIREATDKRWKMTTELHNRYATACSCFFFVLLGSPFAVLMARKQFLTSFLFCFLPILLIYYPVSMMTQNLSKTGKLDPMWAVWSANAIMAVAAGYFFRKVLQN
ncbi:LptF/LptG family permease [bacterium]|nr:LptF/LptG family permease [bacterium]